jgi:hypothetical protein
LAAYYSRWFSPRLEGGGAASVPNAAMLALLACSALAPVSRSTGHVARKTAQDHKLDRAVRKRQRQARKASRKQGR